MGYHSNLAMVYFASQLEKSAILKFENIEDYKKIYAIICGCPFILDIPDTHGNGLCRLDGQFSCLTLL
jgi:hypothetical protein